MLKRIAKRVAPCVLSFSMVLTMAFPAQFRVDGGYEGLFGAERVLAAQAAPTNLRCVMNDNGSITITWDNNGNADSYVISRATSRFGNYVQVGEGKGESFTDNNPNAGKYNNYYKIQTVYNNERSDYSEPISLEIDMFGKNMYVFQESDDRAAMNNVIAEIFDRQHYSQFGENRYAYAFKEGDYTGLDNINIGYYTSIYGLGGTPHPVRLRNVKTPAALDNNNATCNFWVSIENVTIADTDNNGDVWYSFQWGVSQAAPARRLLVERTATFDWFWGWASGGYMADCFFKKAAGSYSQQQYYYRNCYVDGGTYGVNWNQVIQGCNGNTVDTGGYTPLTNNNGVTNWGSQRGSTTVINETEKIREKPFLYFDKNEDEYKVFVPSMRKNAVGTSWGYNDMGAGTSISMDKFYVARSDRDTAQTINAKLAEGYNIILAPGVFYVDEPIYVTNPNTIVLGLGLASIVPMNGESGMKISDVGGVSVAGIIFDAGTYSKTLLTVGDEGCNKDHSDNPIMLQDIFYRVGGTGKVGTTTSCLEINSNDTIVDHTWIWRADHGEHTGWYENTADNGLVVNGDNIICYGLFVEHFQKYDILWRGENGKTYFLQNEKCYDPQEQIG
ncbi:MAG: fibronectin type III domain-containing protein, partial [Lachnospiraceae bacterium]|nr:fibronectin type III domain-containing protein [Lachnospiraceae bacterium]